MITRVGGPCRSAFNTRGEPGDDRGNKSSNPLSSHPPVARDVIKRIYGSYDVIRVLLSHIRHTQGTCTYNYNYLYVHVHDSPIQDIKLYKSWFMVLFKFV